VLLGQPVPGYPFTWSVYRWIEGRPVSPGDLADPRGAAVELARFVAALRAADPAGGPAPGGHNFFRGDPLVGRDAATRHALEALGTLGDPLDREAALAAWVVALRAPVWDAPAVWIHGDLIPGNVLARHGRLTAVIDFGCLGLGDPACDVVAAWTLLSAGTREVFRSTLGVDESTWVRARGWALSFGLIALPYYRDSNPVLAGIARRAVDEVLAEFRRDR
jgi:aminoglycoside phosphotransferase (APT) family kinase protein